MNFRQLKTLMTIADAGGFALAIGRLHLSQPAASRQIQALEAELGVPLFDRVGRRLRLTAEGEEIVRRGRRLLQEADSLRDRANAMKSGLTGTLRVGGSPQSIETVLAPFVRHFRRRHPSIEVNFVEDGGCRAQKLYPYPARLLEANLNQAALLLEHRRTEFAAPPAGYRHLANRPNGHFENARSPASTIKDVKRSIAGKRSREFCAKVFEGRAA